MEQMEQSEKWKNEQVKTKMKGDTSTWKYSLLY